MQLLVGAVEVRVACHGRGLAVRGERNGCSHLRHAATIGTQHLPPIEKGRPPPNHHRPSTTAHPPTVYFFSEGLKATTAVWAHDNKTQSRSVSRQRLKHTRQHAHN